MKQFMAAQDAFQRNDFRDAGLFDNFADLLVWSLVFDSMIGKVGWSDLREEETCELIEPAVNSACSPRKRRPWKISEAFVHSYHIDYDNACQRLIRAGMGEQDRQTCGGQYAV